MQCSVQGFRQAEKVLPRTWPALAGQTPDEESVIPSISEQQVDLFVFDVNCRLLVVREGALLKFSLALTAGHKRHSSVVYPDRSILEFWE